MPYGTIVSKRYYAPRRYVDLPNPRHPDRKNYDYGLVILPRPFPGIRKFMGITPPPSRMLERIRRDGLVTIAGYPGDRPTGTMWRHTENLKRIKPKRLLYSVDT